MSTDAQMTPAPAAEVVVGYDASPDSITALDWAVAVAHRRSAPLCVLTTARYAGVPTPAFAGAPELTLDLAGLARETAEEGRLRAAKVLGESAVREVSDIGSPAGALVVASKGAGLVVVGHSGHGKMRPAVIGSVTFAVAAHAHCPVAVVHGMELVLPGPDRPVVVGTDGSPEAERAVSYAAEEAARWGAPLDVVATWLLPPVEPWRYYYMEPPSRHGLGTLLRNSAEESSRAAAERARRAHPELEVRPHAIEADPAETLTARSEGGGLVVVGSRGLGGFERLIMGSVSRAVLHRAGCPVVVVRS